jgi:Flp pilus assembly protein TadG
MKNGQGGAAAVELAAILPLLVVLVFGMIEFGIMFYNKAVITNASREGARAGITGITNTQIETIIKNYCNANLVNLGDINQNDLDPVGDPDDSITISTDAQNDLTVKIEYGYDFLLSSILGFNATKIEGRTVMRME